MNAQEQEPHKSKSRTFKTPSSVLSYLAFLISCTVIAVLCELNRYPWNQNIILQNITSAAFCVFAASLYIIYMIITALLKLVLTYAESFHPHYHASEYASASFDSEDELLSENEESDSETETYRLEKAKPPAEEDSIEPQRKMMPKRLFYDFMSYYNNALRKQRMQYYSRQYRLPRSIIISSMYLGGSGAFLAITPLCMWDFTMSSAFICSMVFISCIDAQKHATEFKPDLDKAATIRNLKWFRRGYHLATFVAAVMILWLDSEEELTYYITFNPRLNETESKVVYGGHSGLQFKWPLIILSASSPMFLRAGGGGVGNFFFSLPPSQTLETGLPVSTILAILVLFWHSPNEQIIKEIESMIDLKVAIPLFILCPLCIAAALAFILYGFKQRVSGVIAVVLVLILCIRQQTTAPHRLKTHLDCASLISTIQAVLAALGYLVYKHRVMLQHQQLQTWSKKPLIIKEEIPEADPEPSDTDHLNENV